MALNNIGLGMVFTARDLASSQVNRLGRNFQQFERQATSSLTKTQRGLRGFAAGLAVFTAGAVALGGAMNIANQAGEFGQGLAAVGAVTRSTTKELDALRTSAIQAGIATQFSPKEAVDGLTSLATAGQKAYQATQTLVPVLDLAAGSLGQLGVQGAAEAVVGTLNAYSFSAERAGEVTDKLLRITQLTNFQTRDFEVGLSKAAAVGATFGQTLDDVVISMGLLRNRNIEASVAATALRAATFKLFTNQKSQQALAAKGIDVFDRQTGQRRAAIDILTEMGEKTKDLTDKERDRLANIVAGRRGILAFNAIQGAQFTVVRDGMNVTLKGAEAIAAMRTEMGKASGTAAEFRTKLLDTFKGQKTLMKGSIDTLKIVSGEAFARVFKPIVSGFVFVTNKVIELINMVPEPVRDMIAKVAVGLAGMVTAIGGLVALKGAISLLAVAFGFLGISLGGVAITAGVLVAVIGGALLAFKAFDTEARFTSDSTLSRFAGMFEKVSLFFRGFAQIMKEGVLSGPVLDELNKTENQGVKGFLGRVIDLGDRIGHFFDGLSAGFTSAVAFARPVFKEFQEALGGLLKAFGIHTKTLGDTGSADSFIKSGFKIGRMLGNMALIVIKTVTAIVKGITWVKETLDSMGIGVGGLIKIWLGFKILGIAGKFWKLSTAIGGVGGKLGLLNKGGALVGKTFSKLGPVLGKLGSEAGGLLRLLLGPAGGIIAAGAVGYAFGTWLDNSLGLSDALAGVNREIDKINRGTPALLGSLTKQEQAQLDAAKATRAGAIAAVDVAEKMGFFAGVFTSMAQKDTIEKANETIDAINKMGRARAEQTRVREQTRGAMTAGGPAVGPGEAIAAVRGAAGATVPLGPALGASASAAAQASGERETARLEAELARLSQAIQAQPLQVQTTIQMDGETLAQVQGRASRNLAIRAFRPVPVEGG